jgi:tetratricopeptide (TPR) repeat protein
MLFDFDNEFNSTDEPGIQEVVERYRSMLKSKTILYFDPDEFILLIDFYFQKRQYNESLKIIEFAIDQHPSSTELRFKKAEVLFKLKDFTTTLLIINELENIEGFSSYLSYFKGLIYSHLKKKKDAEYCFRKAVLLSHDDEETIEILLQIADHYQEINDLQSANFYLIEAHKIDRDDAEIIIDLAQNFEQLDPSKSIYYYNLYLNDHPFHASVWFDLGVVYSRVNQFEKAIEAFDFALALFENFSEAHFNKGNALANLGKYEAAIESFEDYLQLISQERTIDPGDFLDVYCSIGECYERLGDLVSALMYYQKALDIDPNYADAIFGIGIVNSLCNNLEDSLRFIKKAIARDPYNSEYHYSLGNVYSLLEKNDKALESYKTAVSIDPTDYESWISIAQIYFRKNLLSKAIKTLEEAYQNNKDIAIIEYRLAGYYFLKDRSEEGMTFLRKGLIHESSRYLEFLKIYPQASEIEEISKLIEKFK